MDTYEQGYIDGRRSCDNEIETMANEIAELKQGMWKSKDAKFDSCNRARQIAESDNERLRNTLRRIADSLTHDPLFAYKSIKQIAREAIAK